MNDARQAPRPLGPVQVARRDAEHAVRKRMVALARCAGAASRAARAVGVAARTVAGWARARALRRPGREASGRRGRPRTRVLPGVELVVKQVLHAHGRAVGVPALKALFPAVPRSVLRDLRESFTRGREARFDRLTWTTAGAVWATDFTRPPCLIDGMHDRLLLVRDLASRCTLLALPCPRESAEVVERSLAGLFNLHGPPLVLKTDNGSPFIAACGGDWFTRAGVAHLRSPAYTPRYNGSVEAGGGAFKTRAAHLASCGMERRDGSAGWWSSDDIEAARRCGNTLNRPWGVRGPTPEQRWSARPVITPQRRDLFLATVHQRREAIARAWLERQLASTARADGPGPALPAGRRSSVDRAAIRSALVELGELTIWRPPITSTHSSPQNGRN